MYGIKLNTRIEIPQGWRVTALSDGRGGTIYTRREDNRFEWFYGEETGICGTLIEAAVYVELARNGTLEGHKR